MTKAVVALVLVLATAVVAQTAYLRSMKRSNDLLADRIGRLESRDREVASRAPDAKPSERIEPGLPEDPGSTRAASAAPVPALPSPAAKPALGADEIADLIEKKVDEKVKAKGEDNGFGGKKRPLGEVARELGLPQPVEVRMAEFANEGKKKSFEILRTPRADGTSIVTDIVQAFQSGDQAKENVQAAFLKIFKENVPGTQETYLSAILKVGDEVSKKFESILTPDQLTAFKHTGVGPLDLETGYDPFTEYVKTK